MKLFDNEGCSTPLYSGRGEERLPEGLPVRLRDLHRQPARLRQRQPLRGRRRREALPVLLS